MNAESKKPSSMAEKFKMSVVEIKEILKQAFSLLPKTLILTFILLLLYSLIGAGLKLIFADLSGFSWKYAQLIIDAQFITQKLENIVDYLPNAVEQRILNQVTMYQIFSIIIDLFFILFIMLGLYIMYSWSIYSISQNEEGTKKVSVFSKIWFESMIKPFTLGKKTLLLIGYWILLSVVAPFGLLLFFYPGYFLLINRIYVFNTLLDESVSDHEFKAAKYYTKKSSLMLMMLIFGFLVLPLLLGFIIQSELLPSIFAGNSYLDLITDNSGIGIVFLYHFLYYSIICLPGIIFPTIYHYSFKYVKYDMDEFDYESLFKVPKPSYESVNANDGDKIILWVKVDQDNYNCQECNTEIPLSIKYCSKCGKKYSIFFSK